MAALDVGLAVTALGSATAAQGCRDAKRALGLRLDTVRNRIIVVQQQYPLSPPLLFDLGTHAESVVQGVSAEQVS